MMIVMDLGKYLLHEVLGFRIHTKGEVVSSGVLKQTLIPRSHVLALPCIACG